MRRFVIPSYLSLAASGSAVLLLAACAGAPESSAPSASPSAAFPVSVTSCGFTTTIPAKPTAAVTLNQASTEIALALGVQDQLAGTAYLDDEISSEWQDAYTSIPVLSKTYPSKEALLAVQPDLVLASYASAFADDAVGSQAGLASQNIASYLSPFGCADKAQRAPVSFDSVWDEVEQVGTAFGVPERAQAIEAEQRTTVEALTATKAGENEDIFWYDSGEKTPLAGAGGGGPQLILDTVGARNIFADLAGGWADGSWEKVVAENPDVIVLAEASWSSAQEKIDYLKKDPVLSQLDAVKDDRFVTVRYTESSPGVTLVDGAQSVSDQLEKLDLD